MNKTKSFVFSLLLSILALWTGIFGVLVYYNKIRDAIDTHTIDYLNQAVSGQIDDMDHVISGQIKLLQTVANHICRMEEFEVGEEMDVLHALLQTGEFRRVAIVDREGVSHYVDFYGEGTMQVSEREYYLRVKETKTWYISRPEYSRVDGYECIIIAVPVIMDGDVAGVVTGSYSLERFGELTLSSGRRGAIGTYIMDDEGTIFFGYTTRARMAVNSDNLFQRYSGDTLFLKGTSLEKFKNDIKAGKAGYVMIRRDGELRYVAYAPIGYANWNMIFIAPESSMKKDYQFIHDYSARLVVVLCGAFFLLMLMIIFLYRRMIKEIRQKNVQLAKSEERYRMIEENSNEVFYEYDLESHSFDMGKQIERLLGLPRHFTREQSVKYIFEEDRERYEAFIERIEKGEPLVDIELRICPVNLKQPKWYRIHPVEIAGEGEPRRRIIGKMVDITNQMERMDALVKKSQLDYLTGVYNRESMIRFVNEHINSDPQGQHALLVFDLDKFKQINDTFGHDAGDEVLIWFSALLKSFFRKNDYVGRLGGDEFMVFMVNAGGGEQVIRRMKEFLLVFEERRKRNSCSPGGCSIGAAVYPEDGNSFEELYKQADQAMYEAKRSGNEDTFQ